MRKIVLAAFLICGSAFAQVSFVEEIQPMDGVVIKKDQPSNDNRGQANRTQIPGTSDEKIIIKIGHVAPLTGSIGHLGKDNEYGAQLAIEELNRRSIRIGNKVAKFALLSEDDAANPSQAVEAARRLVNQGAVAVVGHLNSGASIPASKIYSEAGIPQISPSATNPKFTRQGLTNVFRIVADDMALGKALGRIAVKKYGLKKVLLIDDRTAYGTYMSESFEKGLVSAGGVVVKRESIREKTTDFSSVVNLVRTYNPDLIFYGGMDSEAGPLLRRVNAEGLYVKLMGGDGICTSELSKLAGKAIDENQVFCAEAGGFDESQVFAFNTKFKKRFNTDVQLYAPYVYDAVMLIADAMMKSNSINPEIVRKAISDISYDGVTGFIEFDSKGDISNPSISVFTFRNSKRTLDGVLRVNAL